MEHRDYTIKPLGANIWAIEMNMVRAFLVAGEVSALLIDTGAGGVNLQAAVRECTDLPLRVVNTHAHYDHISGNGDFDMLFAHPLELGTLQKAGFAAHPVGDGAGFDLGSRILQVVSLPGHSPGSIALWDAENGLLFAGDTVARSRPIFLCLDGASLEAYLRTLDRILAMENDEHGGTVKRIFCAHGDVETDLSAVRELKALAEQVLAGETKKERVPQSYNHFLADSVGMYRLRDVSLLAP